VAIRAKRFVLQKTEKPIFSNGYRIFLFERRQTKEDCIVPLGILEKRQSDETDAEWFTKDFGTGGVEEQRVLYDIAPS
jgi:hypothetical protein